MNLRLLFGLFVISSFWSVELFIGFIFTWHTRSSIFSPFEIMHRWEREGGREMVLLKAPLLRIRGFFCSFIAFFLVVLSAVLVLNQIQTQTPLIEQKENRSGQLHNAPPLIHEKENQVANQNPQPLTNQKDHQEGVQNPPPLIHDKEDQARNQNPPPLTDQKENQVPTQNPPPLTDQKEIQLQNAPSANNAENKEDQKEEKRTPLEENLEINKPSNGGATLRDGEEKVECDWSMGQWVYDNVTRPLYHMDQCKFMHEEVACDKYGRKDVMYQQWRWQPHSCDLPRFDGIRLLEKIRGKRLVFIGDSLNRNQWAAMACLIESVLPEEQKKRVYTFNVMSLIAKSYSVTVDFYWSPLLVESNADDPVNHQKPTRIMKAYGLEKHAKNYMDADILVFNAHIWWQLPDTKMRILYGEFEDANATITDVEMFEGFEIALNSWSHWLKNHLNNTNKQIFFMTYSTSHSRAEDWGGKNNETCHGETEPIYEERLKSNNTNWDHKMTRKVEEVVANLKTKGVTVQIVNISQLSEYRKDAHPTIYRKFYPTPYDDCTHFCVPGVPDVWNELLYAYIQ
ncbi:hypothetical protein LUZ60_015379 [Juncus effusus]|nr:hypothetical protein LUZ60_015379 [Juncus effusus]